MSEQCAQWGLPLIGEMPPRGFEGGEDARTAESIAAAIRIGAELGADILKTQYTGSRESFSELVPECFVPVVVLGGPRMEDDASVLGTVRQVMDAGARGVAMGRNIWAHPHPNRMTKAIVAVVHEDASLEDALKVLG